MSITSFLNASCPMILFEKLSVAECLAIALRIISLPAEQTNACYCCKFDMMFVIDIFLLFFSGVQGLENLQNKWIINDTRLQRLNLTGVQIMSISNTPWGKFCKSLFKYRFSIYIFHKFGDVQIRSGICCKVV